MTAFESFTKLGNELEISKTEQRRSWHIFKHLPIKEKDNVLFLNENNCFLASWLLVYGLAEKVYIINHGNKEIDIKFNNIFEQKYYLNPLFILPNNSIENDFLKNIFKETNLVVGTSLDIETLDLFVNFLKYSNISHPKAYLGLTRNLSFLGKKGDVYYNLVDPRKFENSACHYLIMHSAANELKEIKDFSKKIKLVDSYIKYHSIFYSLYKDIVIY